MLVQHAGEADRTINYTKLLKVLYLADRKALIETGCPITGDRIVNMNNGPVLSEVYDCIKHLSGKPHSAWGQHFHKEGYSVRLVADPGDSELSDYDVDLLTALAAKYRSHSFGQMVNIVHKLKEWHAPEDGGADPVDYEDVLRAEGLSDERIAEYTEQNEAMNVFEDAVSPAAE